MNNICKFKKWSINFKRISKLAIHFHLNPENNTGLCYKMSNSKLFLGRWACNPIIRYWLQPKLTLVIISKIQTVLSVNKLSASRPNITVLASVSVQPRSCKQFKIEIFKLESAKAASYLDRLNPLVHHYSPLVYESINVFNHSYVFSSIWVFTRNSQSHMTCQQKFLISTCWRSGLYPRNGHWNSLCSFCLNAVNSMRLSSKTSNSKPLACKKSAVSVQGIEAK